MDIKQRDKGTNKPGDLSLWNFFVEASKTPRVTKGYKESILVSKKPK